MSSLTFSGDTVKTSIPKTLYQAIIRIQAEKDVDFDEACEIAGKLVDPRRNDFEKAVKIETDRRFKSTFMAQLNKAKKTIKNKEWEIGFQDGYKEGVDYGYKKASNRFQYPCNICGEKIPLSDTTWESASQFLTEKGWGHTECHEQNN